MSWSRGGLGGEGICSVLDEPSHLRKALPGPPGQHLLGLERERQLVWRTSGYKTSLFPIQFGFSLFVFK